MKIALVGTHNCGKTTLWNLMKQDSWFNDYTFVSEQIRVVNDMGFGINETAGDVTQLVLALENQYYTQLHSHYNCQMVLDRCLLDNYIYALYLTKKHIVSPGVLAVIKRAWDRTLVDLNYVFWLRPEFEMENDGQRSTDDQFQKDIDLMFEKFITQDKYYNNVFYELKGQSKDRLVQLKKIVGGWDRY